MDSHLLDTTGTLFGALWIQDLMGMRRPDFIKREPWNFYGPMEDAYTKFLDDAWEGWLDAAEDE